MALTQGSFQEYDFNRMVVLFTIEERAARKFSDVELEGNPPGVILRAIDFRAPLR